MNSSFWGKQCFLWLASRRKVGVMNVLLVNGSPHKSGCVFSALSEIAETLKKEGVESEIFHIGTRPVQGCAACFACQKEGAEGCVFRDELYLEFVEQIKKCDAIVIGGQLQTGRCQCRVRPSEQVFHDTANAGYLIAILELDARTQSQRDRAGCRRDADRHDLQCIRATRQVGFG